ncbi:MAG: site-specific integrase [Desulfobacterales bacterium]|jgi:integrase
MAISLVCVKCKSLHKLRTRSCSCGNTTFKYRVRVKLSTGKWLTKQTPSLSLAKKVELKFKERGIVGDILGIHPAPLLSDIWKKYFKHAKLNKKTWRDDQSRWDHHIKHLASLKMDKITPGKVQGIIDSMTTQKPGTKKQVLQLINRLYNWSTQQGHYRGLNPCKAVKIPKFDNRLTETLTVDEFKRLLSVLEEDENERAALIIRYAIHSGKRKSEILGLKWSDIEGNFVTYRDTKNTETQTLPVNSECQAILKRAEELKISEYVFPCSTGRYYHSFSRTWYRIRKKAVVSIRFHGLRHAYASFLVSSGKVSLYELQNLLGHKSIHLTQRYAHLLPERVVKTVNTTDEVFRELT